MYVYVCVFVYIYVCICVYECVYLCEYEYVCILSAYKCVCVFLLKLKVMVNTCVLRHISSPPLRRKGIMRQGKVGTSSSPGTLIVLKRKLESVMYKNNMLIGLIGFNYLIFTPACQKYWISYFNLSKISYLKLISSLFNITLQAVVVNSLQPVPILHDRSLF